MTKMMDRLKRKGKATPNPSPTILPGKISTLFLKVTREIINLAVQRHPGKCMIALALQQHPGISSVHVTAEKIRFNYNGVRYMWDMPARPKKELLLFEVDKGAVDEFKFQLDSRLAYKRDVVRRPDATKRGPTRKAKADRARPQVQHCNRRGFHGMAITEPTQYAPA